MRRRSEARRHRLCKMSNSLFDREVWLRAAQPGRHELDMFRGRRLCLDWISAWLTSDRSA
jgi:hypothetical protein